MKICGREDISTDRKDIHALIYLTFSSSIFLFELVQISMSD